MSLFHPCYYSPVCIRSSSHCFTFLCILLFQFFFLFLTFFSVPSSQPVSSSSLNLPALLTDPITIFLFYTFSSSFMHTLSKYSSCPLSPTVFNSHFTFLLSPLLPSHAVKCWTCYGSLPPPNSPLSVSSPMVPSGPLIFLGSHKFCPCPYSH